jgi:UDP-N-acetylglucosamine 2-epimerase (non-hydrolysing)
MSKVFFKELGMPQPDINLGVRSGSHAEQTGEIMMRLEEVLLEQKPDLEVVYGDVNSTLAATLVCSKLLIPVAHVEAGLRSFDRKMPEEINRLLTDQIADLLFTPSIDGNRNLLREGVTPEKIHLVGNVMIDTLLRLLPKAGIEEFKDLGIRELVKNREPYALVTLHRPSNVDKPEMLNSIITTLDEVGQNLPGQREA